MENHLHLPREMEEDEFRRFSFTSSIMPQRSSVTFNRVAPPIRNPENVFEDPPDTPDDESENVFATPTNSRPSSSGGSMVDFGTDSTSTHRSSLVPRSLSPISVADGGWGQFGVYRRSISLARSPSLSAASGSSGSVGLHRSNTANTHTTSNSSTLYSIPSHISGLSSPPSPIHSIAPVRPRFDYGGHQQTLSVDGSSMDMGDPDPFSDGFEVPVTDGFAPHTQRPVASSAASHTGSFGSLPPPYTQYPGFINPKPEDAEIDLGVAVVEPDATHSDSGIPMGEGEDVRRRRESQRIAGAGGDLGTQEGGGDGGGDGDGDPSGAIKEWHENKFLGGRPWIMVILGLVALFIGVALGLGVGLGIGLKKRGKLGGSPPMAEFTTASKWQPAPEETKPPQSDPNNEYPDIPIGQSVISPIILRSFDGACTVVRKDSTTPEYFDQGSIGLWSCNIPENKPLFWDIDDWPLDLAHTETELTKLHSIPSTLTCEEWEDGKWGGYLISSDEGEWNQEKINTIFETTNGERVRYSPRHRYHEGMQGPAFYRQPLAFKNLTETFQKRSNGTNAALTVLSYNFGILYNKTVVLRETTMIETHNTKGRSKDRNGNGSEFQEKEKVWMCVWEKTLLEVTVMVKEPSIAQLRKASAFAGGVGEEEDTADDDPEISALTTIIVGKRPPSTPSPTVSSTAPHHSHPSSEFGSVGDRRLLKRGNLIKGPRPLSRRVFIKESRPSPDRLRRVLGIDLTEPDPEGKTKPGAVWCRKMVVQEDGGLIEFKAEGEEVVETTLYEKIDEEYMWNLAGTDTDEDDEGVSEFPPDTGCSCTWES